MRFALLFLPVLALAQDHRDAALTLPQRLQNKVFRAQISPSWSEDGRTLTYRVQTGEKSHEMVTVNTQTGERTVQKAAPNVASRLTWDGPYRTADNGPETNVTFENRLIKRVELLWADSSGKLQSYGTLPPGESRSMHTYTGHAWLIKEVSGRELGWFRGQLSSAHVVIEEKTLPERKAEPKPAKQKPNAKSWRIKDDNVIAPDGKPLTTDGRKELAWRGPLPSPDGKHLFATQVEPEQEHLVYYIESYPEMKLAPNKNVQPTLHSMQYLKAGDKIAHEHPRLFDLATRKPVPVKEDLMPNPWALSHEHWSADSRTLFLLYNQRGHQLLRLIAIDAATGACRTVIEETSATFVDYSQKTYLEFLDDTQEVIWGSERDGWNHLYLFDAATGKLKNAITKGAWVMRKVEHLDVAKRQVWFMAGGVVPEQDPYYEHLCRVNLDGTGFVVLTEGDGTHDITFSPDRATFVDEWSRVDLPPMHELRRSTDGKLIAKLEQGDASALLATKWQMPERFVAKGRDGTTDIYGVIYRPTHFDASKHYPVVEDIYAGPHGFFVPKAWGLHQRQQQMAELGFIIVKIDGMGTNWRSRAFHDVCWKNLKDAGLPDRIAWIKTAAKTRPWMDLERVGIYGGSAGGQNTGSALLLHGDFYKVGVADCGCHDNRMDKIWWNEAWMGWPVGPEYAESSNVTHAAKLTGKLMLIVGELDTNVDPASTMQVAAALKEAGKDFDLVVVPGAGHGAAETPFGFRKRMDFLTRWLLEK